MVSARSKLLHHAFSSINCASARDVPASCHSAADPALAGQQTQRLPSVPGQAALTVRFSLVSSSGEGWNPVLPTYASWSIATRPGSASRYKTGDWSSRQPEYDLSKCIKCALCQTFCPEGCVKSTDEGFYAADLYYCKGCGICAKECPRKVITMVEEKE